MLKFTPERKRGVVLNQGKKRSSLIEFTCLYSVISQSEAARIDSYFAFFADEGAYVGMDQKQFDDFIAFIKKTISNPSATCQSEIEYFERFATKYHIYEMEQGGLHFFAKAAYKK